MAFRWWADDGPLLALFGSSLPSSDKKKTLSEIDYFWQNLLDPHMLWMLDIGVKALSHYDVWHQHMPMYEKFRKSVRWCTLNKLEINFKHITNMLQSVGYKLAYGKEVRKFVHA